MIIHLTGNDKSIFEIKKVIVNHYQEVIIRDSERKKYHKVTLKISKNYLVIIKIYEDRILVTYDIAPWYFHLLPAIIMVLFLGNGQKHENRVALEIENLV